MRCNVKHNRLVFVFHSLVIAQREDHDNYGHGGQRITTQRTEIRHLSVWMHGCIAGLSFSQDRTNTRDACVYILYILYIYNMYIIYICI